MKITHSDQFKEELRIIISFIAKDKRVAAKNFNRALQKAINTLTDNPYKGRPNDDKNRELIYKGYTVPYFVDDEMIIILGIFNQNEWENKED